MPAPTGKLSGDLPAVARDAAEAAQACVSTLSDADEREGSIGELARLVNDACDAYMRVSGVLIQCALQSLQSSAFEDLIGHGLGLASRSLDWKRQARTLKVSAVSTQT